MAPSPVWPRDSDSLFPLQAALGYELAQSLFISKRQVLVEGLTDLWLLSALDIALAKKGRTSLRSDVTIIPCAGVAKLLPLASMLVGHKVEIAALLDGDEPARCEGKKLVQKLLAGDDRKCLFVGDFLSASGSEIEDLFPESMYFAAVKDAYPNADLTLVSAENALLSVVRKVQAVFQRKGLGNFEKWKAAEKLRDRVLASPETIPPETIEAAESIVKALNALF